jgi:ABC-type antimicrobial peptide transport system permease subunit
MAALASLALGALILLMAVGSVALALTLSVRDRAAEIGLLRALGATSGDVAAMVLAQAASIAVVGGLVGVTLASACEWWLGHLLERLGSGLPDSIARVTAFDASVALIALAIGVLAAVVGAYFPARAAARLDPARAMAG